MKLLINFTQLIVEASKKDILINKVGLSPEAAEKLESKFGGLSVWMANKLMDLVKTHFIQVDEPKLGKEAILPLLNKTILGNQLESSLSSIIDYIRVGLNGNTSTIKDLTFQEINQKSREWHESLNVGQGDVNYIEKHPIVLDFRNDDGEGFYWVNLQTNNSPEECDRMGHCGRSSYGNLYSLRENRKLPGGKYSINKSHLTAAIGDDGILYQLKGPKNSKPKEEFHQYILPLFDLQDADDKPLIEGFGSEYATEQDFKLTDLPNETLVELYKTRPELFNTRSLQRILHNMGIIELPEVSTDFILHIDTDDVNDYIKGDYEVRSRTIKSPAGREYKESIGLFETILSGDMWDMWDNYDVDWKSALEYDVNQENEKKIWELINEIATKENIDIEGMSIKDALDEVDSNGKIIGVIQNAVNSAESDEYGNYLYNTLKSDLEEYGKVIKMDDTGVEIEVDLKNFTDVLSEDEIDEYYETFGDDPEGIFKEMLYEGFIEKPKFSIDDRWYASIDKQNFNEILSDYLSDL